MWLPPFVGKTLAYLVAVVVSLRLGLGVYAWKAANGLERPEYRTLCSLGGGVELREYLPYLIAETELASESSSSLTHVSTPSRSPSDTFKPSPVKSPTGAKDVGGRLAELYSRAQTAFTRTLEAKKTEGAEREQSHSKLRRALTMTGRMSSSEADMTLMQWKGKRSRANNAFAHYVDLLFELASRLFPKHPGAQAVGSVLDLLDDVELAAQASA